MMVSLIGRRWSTTLHRRIIARTMTRRWGESRREERDVVGSGGS